MSTIPPALVPPTLPVPHLAVPFGLDATGAVNVVAQNSTLDVANCVAVLLATPLGQRVVIPSYGIPDPTFTTPDAGIIMRAVNQWEPRAAVTVTVTPGQQAVVFVKGGTG